MKRNQPELLKLACSGALAVGLVLLPSTTLSVCNAQDSATASPQKASPQILAAIKAIIRDATSPEDLKARLVEQYKAMDPRKLADVIEKASVMAELEGRHDVLDGT